MAIVDVSKEPVRRSDPARDCRARPKRRFRARHSKKMVVGLVILGCFIVLGVIGPIIAPHEPDALGPLVGPPRAGSTAPTQRQARTTGWARPTSAATSSPSCWPAPDRRSWSRFFAGAIATALAMVIGITAGYVGGWSTRSCPLAANIFLVIPGAAAADRGRCIPRARAEPATRGSSGSSSR